MRDRIWLSFDLGFGRDHQGMYRWLIDRRARECGPAVATLVYSYDDDLVEELQADLSRAVDIHNGDRIYMIHKDHDDGEVAGRFIFGGRGQDPKDEFVPHTAFSTLH